MKNLLLILALFGLTSMTTGCDNYRRMLGLGKKSNASIPGNANLPIIIVAGQSNAVGLGQDSPSPISNQIIWKGRDIPRGIGVSFAEAYLRDTNQPQIIVAQCSVGSTSIHEWQGHLVGECVEIVKQIQIEHPSAVPAVILFWQGERDARGPGVPWGSLFTSVIQGMRRNLGYKNLPVVFAQLNNCTALSNPYPNWLDIKLEQAAVNIELVQMIKTDDINDLALDGVHVKGNGLYLIGQRMHQAYIGLIN